MLDGNQTKIRKKSIFAVNICMHKQSQHLFYAQFVHIFMLMSVSL